MNCAICDDEKIFCEIISNLCINYMKNKEQNFNLNVFDNGYSLIEYYKQGKDFDIIFLDIKMPNLNGFETANQIRRFDKSVIIIFLTSYFSFAREGYKLNIFRYLLKSKINDDFDEAFSNAIKKRKEKNDRKFTIKIEKGLIKIPFDDIYYFESHRKKITVYTIKENHVFTGKISDVEKLLCDKGFVKPYKGYIINVEKISAVKDNNLILNRNISIPISRKYFKLVLKSIAYSMEY